MLMATGSGPIDRSIVAVGCRPGSRKNRFFLEWLDHNRAGTFPAAFKLVEDLRGAGIKTAVFSASRNAGSVLRSAAADRLFDVKVDGNDLSALGLPGKPDPAMLLEAAERLGVAPANAAVVEDALAGVAAGRAGGFAMVIGVARGQNNDALRQAGADLVVNSLAELRLDRARLTVKTCRGSLPGPE